MTSTTLFRVNQRVSVPGKGVGIIAFVGRTEFADGEWIGVILDEPKGKNNGTVQSKDGKSVQYFTCADNHGLFVRPGQIESVINDLQPNLTRSASNQSIKSQGSSTGSVPAPSQSTLARSSALPTKQSGLRVPTPSSGAKPLGLTRTTHSSNDIPAAVAAERITPKEEIKPPSTSIPQPKLSTTMPPPTIIPPVETTSVPKTSSNAASESSDTQQLISSLKNKITDQEEQIQTLIKKRRDDVEKLKEFERTKIQLDQLQSYKREAQERIKELNDKVHHHEHELKETRDKFDAYREEMADTEVRIESLALDLEMAEERLESFTSENTTLKEKLEEVQLELDVIKGEIQIHGPGQVANGIQQKIDDERTAKMEQALIKLRDLSMTKQTENDALKKQCDALEHKLKILTKENENAKTEITTMQATIADLTEQVDTCLGAQQMVDVLTNRNLALEDQVRELQEAVDNLEALCDMDKEMEENAKEVERELREHIDLIQNQLSEKDRKIEELQSSIGDHERTIVKFRETVRNMQIQNEQQKKRIEEYREQQELTRSAQSSEITRKIVETKNYGEIIEHELKKLDLQNLTKHMQMLTLFLPEQFVKRGADQDCILVVLLVNRLMSRCDLLIREIQKKSTRIDQVTLDDVVKSHRAEDWSSACKLSQSLALFQMILRRFVRAMEVCNPESLRRIAATYHDMLSHEKSLDFLIDRLQKDQLFDSLSLNTLDKTVTFFEHIYKSYLNQETFPMSAYMRDLARVVTLSSDALQTDMQRIQVLQKPGGDQSPFSLLVKSLTESNEQIKTHVSKINHVLPQDDDKSRSVMLDSNSISSVELAVRNLDRLTQTFSEICSGLTTQVLLISDASERINAKDIETIAYQTCDKIYKTEDRGPYESLRNTMEETVAILTTISNSLEAGSFDSTPIEQNSKPTINLISEQFKTALHEADAMRGRLELKEQELLELKTSIKLKQEELSESNIRLSLNEKKIEGLQKEIEDQNNKHKQMLEEVKAEGQKKIKQLEDLVAVLKNENEQFEKEKSTLQERLKQSTRSKLVDDLTSKTLGVARKGAGQTGPTADGPASPQRQPLSPMASNGNLVPTTSEQEVTTLRNTIRLLKDEIWHLKMNRASTEIAKLDTSTSKPDANEIADIYKSSTLLLNDLFSSIANYRITGENVAAKQEIVRSKMKLVDQVSMNLNNRLLQCQSNFIPGSTITTTMKTFCNPQFSKSLTQDRELVAEIQLPGDGSYGGELNVTRDQYRTILRETTGCA